ncbi:hypothetical protein [uncultured Winogradskyella sp.]|uniref:hypothetical protein n=1 Tax=uncultured Winogradskyella sp. TaxID=395353 RepID=UPI002625E989|nr:hypothetical protein [uncultured Winogradskyella sp.]
MIKFFRKIRQNLLSENKISKYLIYAIGEIILVVIGILIALNINNKNEQRIKAEKLDTIYIEIQRELALNINRVSFLIDFYEKKDSLIYLVLNNKLAKADYIKTPEISFVLFDNHQFNIQNKGYLRLTNELDILPENFSAILNKLNIVYEENKYVTDNAQRQYNEFNWNSAKSLSDSKIWYLDFFYKNNLNDEALEYMINDPFYKNKVLDYKVFYINLYLPRFKKNAVSAYEALSKITGKKDHIDTSIYFQTDDDLSKYVGEFKINSNDARFNEEEGYNIINFEVRDSQFYCTIFGDIEIELFPHAENVFILGDQDDAKFSFIQNENGHTTGFQLFNESVYTDWSKIQ